MSTSLSQPPVTLINTMNGITQKYIAPVLVDAVGIPSPTWWRMVRQGKKLQGGGSIVWPVISAEETTGGAYYGVQNLDVNPSDSSRPAEIQWKFYYETVVIPYTDYLLNQGPQQVISLVRAKEEIAMMSLLQKLARAQFGTAPQNTALDLDSLVEALSDTGSYAGITFSNLFWLTNGLNGTTNGGAVSIANMMTDYGSATFGNEEPDTIITTNNGFNAYFALLQQNQRFIRDDETTRGGFKLHLMFNNAVVLRDRFAPAGDMFMLTTKYVYPCFHQDDYFQIEPFVQPTNQRALVSKIYVTLNLKVMTLRQQALRTGITNA